MLVTANRAGKNLLNSDTIAEITGWGAGGRGGGGALSSNRNGVQRITH